MKLYFANTSPYARKTRMTVVEKGLLDRVEMIFANPFEENAELTAANPLGKVPALVTDEGQAIFDSPVICAYLDSLSLDPALIPDDPQRWRVLAHEALTDGVLDAAFAIVMERRRPNEQQSQTWLDRWTTAIFRSVDVLEADIAGFEGDVNIAQIGLGAALGYIDFRLPDINWREGRPKTKAWFDVFSRRASMTETDPENK